MLNNVSDILAFSVVIRKSEMSGERLGTFCSSDDYRFLSANSESVINNDDRIVFEFDSIKTKLIKETIDSLIAQYGNAISVALLFITDSPEDIIVTSMTGDKVFIIDSMHNGKPVKKYIKPDLRITRLYSRRDNKYITEGYIIDLRKEEFIVKVVLIDSKCHESGIHWSRFIVNKT